MDTCQAHDRLRSSYTPQPQKLLDEAHDVLMRYMLVTQIQLFREPVFLSPPWGLAWLQTGPLQSKQHSRNINVPGPHCAFATSKYATDLFNAPSLNVI